MHAHHIRPGARTAAALLAVTVGALGLSACSTDSSSAPQHSASHSASPGDATGKVSKDTTVATVNGHKIDGTTYNITLAQVQAQAQQQAAQGQKPGAKQEKKQAMQAVVGNELLKLEAAKRGYAASDDDVDKQVQKAEKQYGSEKKFTKALKDSDLTLDDYRSQLASQIEISAYVDKELGPFTVSDDQVKQAYEQQKQLSEQQQKQQEKQGGAKSTQQAMPPLKEVRSQLKEQLQQQKQQQAVSGQVTKLKKKATVKVLI